jgi:hypothetical protein
MLKETRLLRPELAPVADWVARFLRPAATVAAALVLGLGARELPRVNAWVAHHSGAPGWRLLGYSALLVGLVGFVAVWVLAVIHAALDPRRSWRTALSLAGVLVFLTPVGAVSYVLFALPRRTNRRGPGSHVKVAA